jgi:hypothetical protein
MNAAIQILLFCQGWNFAASSVQGQFTEWIACQGLFSAGCVVFSKIYALQPQNSSENMRILFLFSAPERWWQSFKPQLNSSSFTLNRADKCNSPEPYSNCV